VLFLYSPLSDKSTIFRFIKLSRDTGSVNDKKFPVDLQVLSDEPVKHIRKSLLPSPRKSLRKLSQQIGRLPTTGGAFHFSSGS
jgi:hypothetical protein